MQLSRKHRFKISLYFTILITLGLYSIYSIPATYNSAGAILLSSMLALSAAVVNISYTRRTARESNSLHFQQQLLNNKNYEENVYVVLTAINNRNTFPLCNFAKPEHALSSEAIAIRYVLNSWEQAANAIRHNIYDEIYLYKSYKSMVLHIGLLLRGYIDEKQKTNISFFENFNWLVLHWTIRRDSFEEAETKRQLKRVFHDLSNIKSGRIKNTQK